MAREERTTFLPGIYVSTTTNRTTGAVTRSGNIQPNWQKNWIVRDSVKTPGWNTRRRPLSSPMNPFYYLKEISKEVSGMVERRTTDGIYNYTGDGLHVFTNFSDRSNVILTAAECTAIDNLARTKLRLKLKDQKVNLAQAFAERTQTANLVAQTAIRLANCMAALKQGKYAFAAAQLGVHVGRRQTSRFHRDYRKHQRRAIASGWLQLQYGWQPLLQDVYGLAELLAQKVSREVINKATATQTRPFQNSRRKTLTGDQAIGGYGGIETVTTKGKWTVKYTVYFATSNSANKTLAQVGITNPALLLWERLPYSFVVDWFIPIGNYLSSLDATLGLSFLKGTKTTFWEWDTVVTRKGSGVPSAQGTMWCDISGSQHRIDCNRAVLVDFPSADFPDFKNPFSPTHVSNALALLQSSFRK